MFAGSETWFPSLIASQEFHPIKTLEEQNISRCLFMFMLDGLLSRFSH